jgi:hypothetical protein
MRYRLRTLMIVLALWPPVLAYVGSYCVLSRRGYAYADSIGAKGVFFFARPDADTDGIIHGRYIRFYAPLIVMERSLGIGRQPHRGTRGLQ